MLTLREYWKPSPATSLNSKEFWDEWISGKAVTQLDDKF